MQMTSMAQITAMKGFLKKSVPFTQKSVDQIRAESNAMAAGIPAIPGVKTEKINICGMAAEWVLAENVQSGSNDMILFFHGGSFVSGSLYTHRDLASRISAASGIRLLNFEYRLAPENKYPAANDDCMCIYNWLLENGFASENIIFGGESIGGYFELMTLLTLRNHSKPLPKAVFFMSPHTDFLYYDGESYITRANDDPSSTLEGIKKCADYYFDKAISDPSVLSPLNEDLSNLPPMFIQVGDSEVILSDSTRLAERAKKAGVQVTLEIWENMWHIFRFMAYMLPEGRQAINNIGEFVKSNTGK
jgi:monoterpene epsilon-lactone hydrolase